MMTKKGFTLIEMLVVISVLSVIGVLILNIFTRTLRGNNKSQIIGAIKQNGQSVLETMDKTIRNSDNVVCVSPVGNPPTIVTVKNGCYTRFRFIAPSPSPSPTTNGQIKQDNPQPDQSSPCVLVPPSPLPSSRDITQFTNSVCIDSLVNPNTLSDTNPQTGVSVENVSFTLDRSNGFADQVRIKFDLWPGKGSAQSVAGQIDPVTFQTTINLR